MSGGVYLGLLYKILTQFVKRTLSDTTWRHSLGTPLSNLQLIIYNNRPVNQGGMHIFTFSSFGLTTVLVYCSITLVFNYMHYGILKYVMWRLSIEYQRG